ncbi:hypothetical protein SAMN05216338_108121 [Bradyrhizobium sp. Rc2d]|uniref:hypothetical protein n=1 Tax=Bradyrhizobium sp. Rc2d TaxID=1855321 RepID=UPI0008888C6C|nr:hypothetical protein [Bradyrhizobium sp. Rc2d]SDK03289.1 hypothetical protein SAMN05216338_108121 [Bradyrhizobium sp. Rc2d]
MVRNGFLAMEFPNRENISAQEHPDGQVYSREIRSAVTNNSRKRLTAAIIGVSRILRDDLDHAPVLFFTHPDLSPFTEPAH